MDVELKHTWRVSKAAWYIRLYLWVWDTREADITFCKLWWAYAFMWLGLPMKCCVVTLTTIGRGIRWAWRKSVGRAWSWLTVPPVEYYQVATRVYDLSSGGFKHVQVRQSRELRPPPIVRGVRRVSRVAITPGQYTKRRIDTFVDEWRAKRTEDLLGVVLEKAVVVAEPPPPSMMRRILSGIEYAGAWMGMQRRRLAPVARGTLHVLSLPVLGCIVVMVGLGRGLRVTVGALFDYVIIPFGEGVAWGLNVMVDVLERIAPPVLDAMEFAANLIWTCLWPVRKLLGLIGRLSIPGRVVAMIWALASLAGFVLLGWSALGTLSPEMIIAGFGVALGCVVAGLGCGLGLAYCLEHYLAPAFYRYMVRPIWYGAETGGEITKMGMVGFGKIMLIGFKSVKSNTCPKVEVEE